MSNTVQNVLDKLSTVFTVTEEMLNDWSGEGCLQFPALMASIAVKLNWDEKQVREADPLVRYYVRNNPNWHVTRGAHGGIMRLSDKQNRESAKQAKDALKAQMKAAIEAQTTSTAPATDSE